MLLVNEIPTGFADLYNITIGKECFIGNLVISKNYRKMGHSKVLLEEIIQKGITQYNVQRIYIHCWCENTAAILLYEKFCFKPVEIVVREFEKEKIPVLLLEKSINPE
jgi:ribosomal protein S18 acetylase RimI-like enzyme